MPETLCLLTSENEDLCSAGTGEQLLPVFLPELHKTSFSPLVKKAGFTLWSKSGTAGSKRVIFTGACRSTLDLGWSLAKRGMFRTGDWLFAHSQWEGRGQYGRTWWSPPGNLYATFFAPQWQGEMALSVLAGYILTCCLAELGIELRIKWPNDLLCQDRKLAGVLVEQRAGMSMLGLGINISVTPGQGVLGSKKGLPAICLQEILSESEAAVSDLSLGLVSLRLVSCFDLCYASMAELSAAEVREYCEQHLAYLGKLVTVRQGESCFQAKVVGLGLQGQLMVDDGRFQLNLSTGSILSCKG